MGGLFYAFSTQLPVPKAPARPPKPHLTISDQVAQLQNRGMAITDSDHIADCLRRIGYYRLAGYWRPFQINRPDESEKFSPDTDFPKVLALYLFDKRLRLALLDALERIEIALRTEIAYHMGSKDRLAHQNKELLNPKGVKRHYDKWRAEYNREVKKSREPFVKHHHVYYDGEIPIWVATELWSFGRLSRFYGMMRGDDQKAVSRQFGVENVNLMERWLYAMTFVRNIAAHHNRLWNRAAIGRLSPTDAFPGAHNPPLLPDGHSHNKIYPVLCAIVFLVRQITPNSQWPHRLREMLLELNPKTGRSLSEMGFPPDWARSSFWRA